jgi:hypothetical protein
MRSLFDLIPFRHWIMLASACVLYEFGQTCVWLLRVLSSFIEHFARNWATHVKLASLFLIITHWPSFLNDKVNRMYHHAHCVYVCEHVCSIFEPFYRFSLNLLLHLCHSSPFQYHSVLFYLLQSLLITEQTRNSIKWERHWPLLTIPKWNVVRYFRKNTAFIKETFL